VQTTCISYNLIILSIKQIEKEQKRDFPSYGR